MRHIFTVFLIPTLILKIVSVSAQISLEDVDQQNQAIFPLYTNIQTYNSMTGFQDPNGDYTSIFTTAAGHHTDSTATFLFAVTDHYNVTPEQQAIANADPLRHLWTYNREEFAAPEQYADSLHAKISIYYTVSSITEYKKEQVWFYPNPSACGFYLSSTAALSNIEIFNTCGQKVFGYREISENQTLYINIIEQPGVYIFRAMNGDTPMIKKLIKQ